MAFGFGTDYKSAPSGMREAAGPIDTRIIAEQMLESKVDFNDYFIKRLIITEIVY